MTKVPVLVTGGAGYIGSHAVLALRDAGWSVAVIDDLSNGARELVPEGVPFYHGTIAERVLVDSILDQQRIGAIMHFAGSIVVPESVEKPLDYYRNNTVASHALVSAAVAADVKHILFSSTAAVYGAPSGCRSRRATRGADQPLWRVQADDRADARRCVRGLPIQLWRAALFQRRRSRPEGRAGQIGKGSTHLIKVAVEAAVGKRDHVDVFGTDYLTSDGTCVRDYIHVSDLAAAHVAALERLIERPDEDFVLNCGYGTGLSVLQVLDAVDRVNGAPVERRMAGRRAGDPPALVASNAALLETLDWRPQYADIDRIVSDALAWERRLAEA